MQTEEGEFPGFASVAFTWGQLVTTLDRSVGAQWFSQYPLQGVADAREQVPELATLSNTYSFADDWQFARPFGFPTPDDQFRQVPVSGRTSVRCEDHDLGITLLELLDQMGIAYDMNDNRNEVLCVLPSPRGPIIEYGSIWVGNDGKASIAWTSDLLACFADLDISEPDLQYLQSRLIHVPAVIQAAFFLAETPFPSAGHLYALERSIAYAGADIPTQLLPSPFVEWYILDDVIVPKVVDGQLSGLLFAPFPGWVVRAGFEISDDLSLDQLQVCLSVAIKAFPKIHVMLHDGLAEGEAQSAANFQEVLAADEPGGGVVSYVPYLLLADLANRS